MVLRPTTPQNEAGRRIDPPVSEPMRGEAEARGDRHPRSVRRAPGRAPAREIARIARRPERLVGAPAAEGEFHGVGLAEDDRARRAQPRDDRRVRRGGRDAGAAARAAAGRQPGDVDEVLDPDRRAGERPERRAKPAQFVDAPRVGHGARGVERDEGVQPGIARGDVGERRGHDLLGAPRAARQSRPDFGDGPQRCFHGPALLRARTSPIGARVARTTRRAVEFVTTEEASSRLSGRTR